MWWRRKRAPYPSGRTEREKRQPEKLQRTLVAISLERAQRGEGDVEMWITILLLGILLGGGAVAYLAGGF